MPRKATISSPLHDKLVALPESRQLDVLADLFERRRARVLRVPLVSILDAPDQAPIVAWIEQFIAEPPDRLVILTGEGLRRLFEAAERAGLQAEFVAALATVCKICRGPKPGRALKEIDQGADVLAAEPTTAGIITTLKTMELAGTTLSVQLYGEDPNLLLMEFLSQCDLKRFDTVAPYIYASHSDTDKVQNLIQRLHAGEIDLIAFTSKSQISRLFGVAKKEGLESNLRSGLGRTRIAAIGPIVKDELMRYDCEVHIMPDSSFFMKPLVRAAELLYSSDSN